MRAHRCNEYDDDDFDDRAVVSSASCYKPDASKDCIDDRDCIIGNFFQVIKREYVDIEPIVYLLS